MTNAKNIKINSILSKILDKINYPNFTVIPPGQGYLFIRKLMFRSSHFSFLVTFGNEVTKIQKYFIIFVYILQGKMGKTEKNGKKITQLK